MGKLTADSVVFRAVLLKQATTLWVAIGRTTVWPGDGTPPAVDITAHDIDEVICYTKPTTISMAKLSSGDGDVTVNDVAYDLMSDGAALLDQDAKYMYIFAEFDPTAGQDYGNFRQVAVYANTVPILGHAVDTWLNPEHVSDPGALCSLHNGDVTYMAAFRKQAIDLILQF